MPLNMAYNLQNSPNWVICDHLLAELCLELHTPLTQVRDKTQEEELSKNAGLLWAMSTKNLLKAAKKKEHKDGRKRSRRYLVLIAVVGK